MTNLTEPEIRKLINPVLNNNLLTVNVIIMWAGPHTDLLSGKSMFIDMHDIGSAGESTLCFTVQWHEYTCSGIIITFYVKIQHKDNIICGALCQNIAG